MSGTARIEPVSDQTWRIVGELTLQTLPALLAESARLRGASPARMPERRHAALQEFELDLSGVTRIDSSAIALLLAWTRAARQMGKTVRFRQTPRQLLAIAEVSGVRTLLPLVN